MKSYSIIIKTHEYCHFAIFGEKYGFWTKTVSSRKPTCLFRETRVIGTENNLWKCELDKIISLDFTDIWSVKYKEIRGSGAKFLRSINKKSILQICVSYHIQKCHCLLNLQEVQIVIRLRQNKEWLLHLHLSNSELTRTNFRIYASFMIIRFHRKDDLTYLKMFYPVSFIYF